MPQKKIVNFQFPLGGLDRSGSYGQQPPYTTPDCLNVRPRDVFKRRLRGGSRPGMEKAYHDRIGTGSPIRLLNSVTVIKDDGYRHWTDYFDKEDLGTQWTKASWVGKEPRYFPWDTTNLVFEETGGLVREKWEYLDSKPYLVTLMVLPWKKKHHGTYTLYARLNDDTPDVTTDGIEANLVLSGLDGTYSGTLKVRNNKVETVYNFATGKLGFAASGWYTLYINGSTVKATFYGKTLIEQDISAAIGAGAGSRVGFGMACTNAGGICLADAFRSEYYIDSVVEKNRTFLVASAEGGLYIENFSHGFDRVDTEIILSSDRLLQSAERAQQLFIADGLIPKVYDGVQGTLKELQASLYDDSTPKGVVPVNAKLVCVYRDRLVFAAENWWFMSRDGDPTDWDYGVPGDDVGRAVAGWSADAGLVGDFITALIPHNDDYLVFGAANSVWVLRGDPGYDGQLDNLSRDVGIVGPSAWCKGPTGEIVFLSKDGLYVISPGAEGPPQALSRAKLPAELLDLDPDLHTITMAYDIRDQGIHLYLTPEDPKGNMFHWWIDWEYKSFWPMDTAVDYEPTALLNYKPITAVNTAVLLGGRDGYIRRYFQTSGTDDGTPFYSHILYGPISLGGTNYFEGTLQELTATIGKGSSGVYWYLRAADNAEDIVTAATRAQGMWQAGMNYTDRPGIRGAFMGLRLYGSIHTGPWAMEDIVGVIQRNGRRRKA